MPPGVEIRNKRVGTSRKTLILYSSVQITSVSDFLPFTFFGKLDFRWLLVAPIGRPLGRTVGRTYGRTASRTIGRMDGRSDGPTIGRKDDRLGVVGDLVGFLQKGDSDAEQHEGWKISWNMLAL